MPGADPCPPPHEPGQKIADGMPELTDMEKCRFPMPGPRERASHVPRTLTALQLLSQFAVDARLREARLTVGCGRAMGTRLASGSWVLWKAFRDVAGLLSGEVGRVVGHGQGRIKDGETEFRSFALVHALEHGKVGRRQGVAND